MNNANYHNGCKYANLLYNYYTNMQAKQLNLKSTAHHLLLLHFPSPFYSISLLSPPNSLLSFILNTFFFPCFHSVSLSLLYWHIPHFTPEWCVYHSQSCRFSRYDFEWRLWWMDPVWLTAGWLGVLGCLSEFSGFMHLDASKWFIDLL